MILTNTPVDLGGESNAGIIVAVSSFVERIVNKIVTSLTDGIKGSSILFLLLPIDNDVKRSITNWIGEGLHHTGDLIQNFATQQLKAVEDSKLHAKLMGEKVLDITNWSYQQHMIFNGISLSFALLDGYQCMQDYTYNACCCVTV